MLPEFTRRAYGLQGRRGFHRMARSCRARMRLVRGTSRTSFLAALGLFDLGVRLETFAITAGIPRSCVHSQGFQAFQYSVGRFESHDMILGSCHSMLGHPSDLAFMAFKAHVLDDSLIIEHIRFGVRDWLVSERNKGCVFIWVSPSSVPFPFSKLETCPFSMESPHRECIQNLVSHLVTHGVYAIIFERFVAEQTLTYYSEEAEEKIHKMNITPELFLAHVTQRVAEEEARAVAVFQSPTVLLVQHATRRGLLEGRLEWLAHGGVGSFRRRGLAG